MKRGFWPKSTRMRPEFLSNLTESNSNKILIVGRPLAAQRLPNGNTFIGTQATLVEVTRAGKVIWEYNTIQDFTTVNGVPAKGGSMGAAGPVIAGGVLFVPSGYVGVRQGLPGNVLLAMTVQ